MDARLLIFGMGTQLVWEIVVFEKYDNTPVHTVVTEANMTTSTATTSRRNVTTTV